MGPRGADMESMKRAGRRMRHCMVRPWQETAILALLQKDMRGAAGVQIMQMFWAQGKALTIWQDGTEDLIGYFTCGLQRPNSQFIWHFNHCSINCRKESFDILNFGPFCSSRTLCGILTKVWWLVLKMNNVWLMSPRMPLESKSGMKANPNSLDSLAGLSV